MLSNLGFIDLCYHFKMAVKEDNKMERDRILRELESDGFKVLWNQEMYDNFLSDTSYAAEFRKKMIGSFVMDIYRQMYPHFAVAMESDHVEKPKESEG